MNITIGSLQLTDANAPKVTVKTEYYKTDTGVIIGGKKNITISGVVFYKDDGSLTASSVMKQLKNIRDLVSTEGKNCLSVTIPNVYSGNARISNIDIEQGSDPTWVNTGGFTILIEAPLTRIPPNNLGIVAEDYVKSLSFAENISLGEDAHGFVLTTDLKLSKAFVRFSFQLSVEVDPICTNNKPSILIEKLIRKLIKKFPSHPLLTKYRSWTPYLQDRNYTFNNNSGSLKSETILLHPSKAGLSAYVDLNFKHNRTYDDNREIKTISGNIKGLINVPWIDIIYIGSISSLSALSSAETALNYIKSKFVDLSSWTGIEYALFQYDCPPASSNICLLPPDDNSQQGCYKPSSSTISRARTEGSIDFSFEWTKNICNKSDPNVTSIEYTVDDNLEQPSIATHEIPTGGVLLQDLNCYTARKISFSSVVSFPESNCLDEASRPLCAQPNIQDTSLNKYIFQYMLDNSLDPLDFMLISHSYSRNNRANTLSKGYISKCKTTIRT